jgi:hypothetical protein
MNLDDQRPAFLFHYTAALATCVAGIIVAAPWLAGCGSGLMIAWVLRARRL